MTRLQKDFAAWLAEFDRICVEHGGVKLVDPCGNHAFSFDTTLGRLRASVHDSDYEAQKKHGYVDIYLRFDVGAKANTGNVYDTLGGRSFNGWSGKWNISASGDLKQSRESAFRQLKDSLAFAGAPIPETKSADNP